MCDGSQTDFHATSGQHFEHGLYRLTREPRWLARLYSVQGSGTLLRAGGAQLICYPGEYYAATPSGDRAAMADAAEPASA
jgi:N-acetylglucosaminyldiphosphoundecaprenol N-acetyl-beta-D-mannosaminyltransferase